MTIKTFEQPLIELSHSLVFQKAKLIDKEYKLSVADLNASEKLTFVSHFLNMNNQLDSHIQEYLNDACMDRMYAESQPYGAWDE